jgi:hypothetical protein
VTVGIDREDRVRRGLEDRLAARSAVMSQVSTATVSGATGIAMIRRQLAASPGMTSSISPSDLPSVSSARA